MGARIWRTISWRPRGRPGWRLGGRSTIGGGLAAPGGDPGRPGPSLLAAAGGEPEGRQQQSGACDSGGRSTWRRRHRCEEEGAARLEWGKVWGSMEGRHHDLRFKNNGGYEICIPTRHYELGDVLEGEFSFAGVINCSITQPRMKFWKLKFEYRQLVFNKARMTFDQF